MIEILGTIASIIIVVSFLFNNMKIIRIINIIGSIIFIIYGIAISAFSVWLLNAMLLFIHIYKLIKNKKNGAG